VLVLDSFGDDVEPERVSELDRRPDEVPVTAPDFCTERKNESAVELHLRDRQVVEVRE
jgi:hypothetical protein